MFGSAQATYDRCTTIEPDHLLQELRSGRQITIVDVRDLAEMHRYGCIEHARSIPLRQLIARHEELLPRRGEMLVTVSGCGARARRAAQLLGAIGFEDVRYLEGGMTEWLKRGLPSDERRSSRPPY